MKQAYRPAEGLSIFSLKHCRDQGQNSGISRLACWVLRVPELRPVTRVEWRPSEATAAGGRAVPMRPERPSISRNAEPRLHRQEGTGRTDSPPGSCNPRPQLVFIFPPL
jgi:hypothetical protein